jgi:hypothetical protein
LRKAQREHLPEGFRVHAYIDCGSPGDGPYQPECGFGYVDTLLISLKGERIERAYSPGR